MSDHEFSIGDIVLAAYDSTELEIVTGTILAEPSLAVSSGELVTCAGLCHRVRRLRDNRYGWARPEDLRQQEPSWFAIGALLGTDIRHGVMR